MLKKALDISKEVLERIPVANLIPVLVDLSQQLPAAYMNLPEEKRQEVATDFLLAAAKMAKNYHGEKL